MNFSELYGDEEHFSNKCFLHEANDSKGRPVVVVQVKNHRIGEYPIASSQNLCVVLSHSTLDLFSFSDSVWQIQAMIEKAIERMDDPHGQVCLLFDLDGFSLRNADFGFAKFLG